MKYRYFMGLGVVSIVVAVVLGERHVAEENSPLVFGPAFLGLAAILSPLVLGWAREPIQGVRPGGKAVLQSLVFPLVGLAMTVVGLLGEAGAMRKISFDGPKQHCRTCASSWSLSGERDGRPHYLEQCFACAEFPAVDAELKALLLGLEARACPTPDSPAVAVQPEVLVINRAPLRLSVSHGLELRRPEDPRAPRLVVSPDFDCPLVLRLDVDGERTAAAHEYRLTLRLSVFDRARQAPTHQVERTVTVQGIPRG